MDTSAAAAGSATSVGTTSAGNGGQAGKGTATSTEGSGTTATPTSAPSSTPTSTPTSTGTTTTTSAPTTGGSDASGTSTVSAAKKSELEPSDLAPHNHPMSEERRKMYELAFPDVSKNKPPDAESSFAPVAPLNAAQPDWHAAGEAKPDDYEAKQAPDAIDVLTTIAERNAIAEEAGVL